MISFDQLGTRFKYRVAGLAVHDGYVLLTKADQDEYWIRPGGRVELGEDTRTALEREFVEKTGHETRIGDLLLVVENVFHLDGTDYHELTFTYAISPKDPAMLSNAWAHRTADGDDRIELRWSRLEGFETIPFQPAFLKPFLRNPLGRTQQVILRQPHGT